MNWWQNYWGMIPLTNSGLSNKKLAKYQNQIEFINCFEKYFTIAQDQFVWEGLPDTIDERFLERAMLLFGQCMIAKVNESYIVLAAVNGANININGYPLTGWGWGLNGFNKEFKVYVPGADDSGVLTKTAAGLNINYSEPEAVIGYDNVDRFPYVNYIIVAARRMSDLIRSCDVAVKGMKSPFLITCDETQVNSIKKALQERDDNNVAIIASKASINSDMFKVWPTDISADTLKAFWEQYRNIENELLETLGINSNDNTDKKERLLVDEVNANNEEVNSNLAKRLRQREIFADRVNKQFGLNISVHLRDEYFEEEGIEDEHDSDDTGAVCDNETDKRDMGSDDSKSEE